MVIRVRDMHINVGYLHISIGHSSTQKSSFAVLFLKLFDELDIGLLQGGQHFVNI